jgi:hypothetical protein
LIEVREVVPEDQAPSPSLAAFNRSFGTSHRGKLLSVGFETTGVGIKTSKILTLWKSSVTVHKSGGESSGQPEGAAQGSEKGPHPTPEATSSPQGNVDVKCALNANHTASRKKLASHAQRVSDVPVNFS